MRDWHSPTLKHKKGKTRAANNKLPLGEVVIFQTKNEICKTKQNNIRIKCSKLKNDEYDDDPTNILTIQTRLTIEWKDDFWQSF